MPSGRHWAYYVVSLTITLVLSLAANTSFGGLPVLASLLSRTTTSRTSSRCAAIGKSSPTASGHSRSSRVLCSSPSTANTDSLIPLFAIGVFTGFTLAQSGLVVHWLRGKRRRWRRRAAINGLGAAMTAIATVVFLVSKFLEGAWVVVVAVPLFVLLFVRIHTYYDAREPMPRLRIATEKPEPTTLARDRARDRAVAPHDPCDLRGALAQRGSDRRQRVRSAAAKATTAPGRSRRQWATGTPAFRCGYSVPTTPRSWTRSSHSSTSYGRKADKQIVVLIPVVIPDKVRYRLLHNQIDLVLSRALHGRPDVVVARTKFSLEELARESDEVDNADAGA